MQVKFGVLGPVAAWDSTGAQITLKGPRHRAVLARLIVARGHVVPVHRLVTDLWDDPPPGAIAAVRTFVAALRRCLEPQRPPRSPATVLVTDGPGYALRTAPDSVDAWRFEAAQSSVATLPPSQALAQLDEALTWWRGPAYADFDDEPWTRTERARLLELRLDVIEQRAQAQLALGFAAQAAADLDAHTSEHPWRENAWRLLALALYRAGRQADALAVLRRARTLLAEHLGLDPGPRLNRLETDILQHASHLEAGAVPDATERIWAEAAAAYQRTVAPGARSRLESTVGLLRSLAVTGGSGLAAARAQRLAAVTAAEQLGDARLSASVIGAYDVPGLWTRSDDPAQATQVVTAAERTLAALPDDAHSARARLLATIAMESRGTRSPRGPQAAREAEEIARRLDDPAVLAFALNGVFLQTFHRAGLAPERDRTGAELISLSAQHGMVNFEILGHLIRVQARSALADFAAADQHAAVVDKLAESHERPLVAVFTQWYRALRLASSGAPLETAEAAYRDAATRLDGAGMPGVERGILPLTLLCLRTWHDRPATFADEPDWGPYEPWALPLVLLSRDRPADAAAALRRIPDPPPDLLLEALWALIGHAALAVDDRFLMARAHAQLAPAAEELAGAGSGLLTVGPVATHLRRLATALDHGR